MTLAAKTLELPMRMELESLPEWTRLETKPETSLEKKSEDLMS